MSILWGLTFLFFLFTSAFLEPSVQPGLWDLRSLLNEWRHALLRVPDSGLLRWLTGEECACNEGDVGSIPGWGRSPGGGNGNPLHHFCQENPMDRRAWRATVCGVTKSQAHRHTGNWLSEVLKATVPVITMFSDQKECKGEEELLSSTYIKPIDIHDYKPSDVFNHCY